MGDRLQKSLNKIKAKTTVNEADILQINREIKMSLLEADVNLLVVKDFIKSVKEKAIGAEIIGKLNPGQQYVKIVHEELTNILGKEVVEPEVIGNPFVVMMTGLQGSGKTTSTAKIVKWYMKKKGVQKPLMVAADVYRPAAVEQLITLGKQINIDVYSQGTEIDPRDIVKNSLTKARDEGYDMVVIDTAGRLSIDEDLMKELVDIKSIAKPTETLFVADALSGQDIINVAKSFHEQIKLSGSIITKLDSDARGGAALSIRKLLDLPIRFIGTGEKISNLDLFHPNRMADRILGMGDVLSLIEKAGEVIDEKQSKHMLNRMVHGHFDLNDLIGQLRQMKKFGSMSKIMKMIPGMAGKISDDRIEKGEKKLVIFEILISSMTKTEKKNPKLLKQSSRKQRIIKGSGRTNQEYNMLVNEFERMAKQMTNIAKSVKSGSFNPGMLGGMGL